MAGSWCTGDQLPGARRAGQRAARRSGRPAGDPRNTIETALTGPQSAVVLVDDLEQGLKVVDAYGARAPQGAHRDTYQVAHRVRNAGAIFIASTTS